MSKTKKKIASAWQTVALTQLDNVSKIMLLSEDIHQQLQEVRAHTNRFHSYADG